MLNALSQRPVLNAQTARIFKQPSITAPRFGAAKEPTTKEINKEMERLRSRETSALGWRPIGAIIHSVMSPFAPAGLVTPLSSISNSQNIVANYEKIFKPRAMFNLTGDAKHLNQCLPYRASIQDNPIKLAKYEELVKRIQDKAIMGKLDGNKFLAIFKMATEAMSGDKDLATKIMNEPDQEKKKALMKEQMQKIDVDKIVKHTPIDDPSSKYMYSAAVVELFHNRPELIDKVLDRKKPLKMLLSNEPIMMPGGYYMPVHNLIVVDDVTLWVGAQSSTQIPQHEFVHAVSTRSDEAGIDLEEMTDAQKATYTKIHEQLKKLHNENEGSFLGKLKYWVTGKPSSGIRPYAFILDQEFITVTTDMFTRAPKLLKETKEGRELYNLYTEFFGADPDKDWKYDKGMQANVAEEKAEK